MNALTPQETEVYVMILLGHLKLAHDRGIEGAQEYCHAGNVLGGEDPIERVGKQLARDVARKEGAAPRWPEEFHLLRESLDPIFAPDPAASQPRRRATLSEVLALVDGEPGRRLASAAGLEVEQMFDHRTVQRIVERREWAIPRDVPFIRQVAGIIRTAPSHIGDMNLLQWVSERLLSGEARSAFAKMGPLACEDYLLVSLTDPAEQIAWQSCCEEVEFRYGMLTPLLSFAAVDRRLERIQSRVVEAAQDALVECESQLSGPDQLRDVVELRAAAAIELQGRFREAARLLIGGASSHRRDASAELEGREAGGSSGLLDRIAQRVSSKKVQGAGSRIAGRPMSELDRPPVVFRWEDDAESPREWDRVAVTEEDVLQGRVAQILRAVGFGGQPPAKAVVLRGEPDGQVLLRIVHLGDTDRAMVLRTLADGMASAPGNTVKQRVLNARLQTPGPDESLPRAMDNRGDEMPSVRLLFARAMELLDPRPLSEHGGDLLASLEQCGRRLDGGAESHQACEFTCPTLQELSEEVLSRCP